VFANSEEVVEGCVGQVVNGLGFGGVRLEAFLGTPMQSCHDWDGKLCLWHWIDLPTAFNLLLQGFQPSL
jgi:hypothetical protein